MARAGDTYIVAITCDSTKARNRFFCKLFDDMIVHALCRLRRRELNDHDRFSCAGCRKDRIMSAAGGRLAAEQA